jgi:cytochrome c
MRYIIPLVFILALVMTFAGCASAATSPPNSQTPADTSAAPTASAAGETFGQIATAGKTVYASKCAGCHGDNGQGVTAPAVMGANAQLSKYNTAQGLLDYISISMPFNAPGKLSRQEYLNVLSFLLVQNNLVPSGNPFDSNQLNTLQLK